VAILDVGRCVPVRAHNSSSTYIGVHRTTGMHNTCDACKTDGTRVLRTRQDYVFFIAISCENTKIHISWSTFELRPAPAAWAAGNVYVFLQILFRIHQLCSCTASPNETSLLPLPALPTQRVGAFLHAARVAVGPCRLQPVC